MKPIGQAIFCGLPFLGGRVGGEEMSIDFRSQPNGSGNRCSFLLSKGRNYSLKK
jgi:hypothetical protein